MACDVFLFPSSLRRSVALSLVIVSTAANRQLVIAVSDAAHKKGIRPGMTLAQARALCADIEHLEHEPQKDQQGLEAIARWLMRFSPCVAIQKSDECKAMSNETKKGTSLIAHRSSLIARSPGICLDLTGTRRLLGDPANIAQRIGQSLRRWGVNAKLGLGHTPGAAWAGTFRISDFGFRIEESQSTPFSNPQSAARLSSPKSISNPQFDVLPVVSLRLPPDTLTALHHLGIQTIGQVRRLPRAQLPARFGDILHTRLDQLDGVIQEPLVPIEPVWPIVVRHDFQEPVEDLQIILRVLEKLTARVAELLVRRGHGAREIRIELQRPGAAEAVAESVRFSRPTRDAKKMMSLTTCAIEKVLAAAQGPGNGGRWQSNIARAKKRFWGKRFSEKQDLTKQSAVKRDQPTPPAAKRGQTIGWGARPRTVDAGTPSPEGATEFPSPAAVVSQGRNSFAPSGLVDPIASTQGLRPGLSSFAPSGLGQPIRHFDPLRAWEFRAVRVSVVLSQRVTDEQISLLGGDEFAGRMELDDLVERLRVRMGQDQLTRAVVVESYLPERAWDEANDEIRNQKPESNPNEENPKPQHRSFELRASNLIRISGFGFRASRGRDDAIPSSILHPPSSLPLLLHPPRELKVIVSPSHDRDGRPVSVTDPGGRVHTIVHAVGPHRVAGEWWRGHDKSRDYFDIELPDGRRWWVFRVNESGRWFWQGGYQ